MKNETIVLNSLFLILIFFGLFGLAKSSRADTYYVKKSCAQNGDGTQPCCQGSGGACSGNAGAFNEIYPFKQVHVDKNNSKDTIYIEAGQTYTTAMLSWPTMSDDVFYGDWKGTGTDRWNDNNLNHMAKIDTSITKTSWTPDGSLPGVYYTQLLYALPFPSEGSALAYYNEMESGGGGVWSIDGSGHTTILLAGSSANTLSPNQYYYDHSLNMLYIRHDPAGKVIKVLSNDDANYTGIENWSPEITYDDPTPVGSTFVGFQVWYAGIGAGNSACEHGIFDRVHIFYSAGDGINVGAEAAFTRGSVNYSGKRGAVFASEVNGSSLKQMIIQGSLNHGYYQNTGIYTVPIYNCVFYGNGGDGLRFEHTFGNDYSITVRNTVSYNNAGYEFYADSGLSAGSISNNCNGGGTYGGNWSTIKGTSNVESNPVFTNAPLDFTPAISSPLINAGVDLGFTTDYAGRAIAGIPDIGAYEYVSGDTTPPTLPTGLSASAVSSSQINLSWTASTDNVGIAGYKIFRNGTQVGTSVNTSYSDSGLTASTTYTYTVSAYDAAGNNSGQSISASATTLNNPPINYLPFGYLDSADQNSITGWAYDQNAGTAPINVQIYIDGVLRATVMANGNRPDLIGTGGGLVQDAYHGFIYPTPTLSTGTHEVRVYAVNTPLGTNPELSLSPKTITIGGNTGNKFVIGDRVKTTLTLATRLTPSLSGTWLGVHYAGDQGTIVDGPVNADGYIWWRINYDESPVGWSVDKYLEKIGSSDTTPPIISAVSASSVSGSSAIITWTTNEPSDSQVDYGLTTSYGNSTTLDTSLITSHSQILSGLSASTLYHFRVRSKDVAGNTAVSADSVLTTTSTDTIAPTVPTGLAASVASASQINLSWTASTDNVGVAGYKIFRNGTQVGTSANTSYSDTSLAPNTSYTYTVSAYDAAGNNSGQSISASATTPAGSSGKFNMGDRVKTTSTLMIRPTPSLYGIWLGVHYTGDQGTIIGGPMNADGYIWWKVNYDDDPSGWSVENYLNKI